MCRRHKTRQTPAHREKGNAYSRMNKPCGAVQIYQEFIADKEITKHLEQMISDFLTVGVVSKK